MRFLILILFPCLLFSVPAPDHRQPSDPFVSGDGFRAYADYVYDEEETSLDPLAVTPRSTIFVKIDKMESFFKEIHPQLLMPYILITHNGDDGAPGPYRPYLEDPKLLAWFTENLDGPSHPKLHPIPIGIANRYWGHGNPDVVKKAMEKMIPKRHLLYYNLTIQNYYEERWQVFQLLGRAPFCFRTQKKRFDHYLEDVAASKFVLSPRGNGLDTHRLWESLYLGSYPIVKTSSLDPLYADLPVVIVQDWSEVTPAFLQQKEKEMAQKTYQLEKLTMEYWNEQIDHAKSAIF
jgi:hypothetical protein